VASRSVSWIRSLHDDDDDWRWLGGEFPHESADSRRSTPLRVDLCCGLPADYAVAPLAVPRGLATYGIRKAPQPLAGVAAACCPVH